MFYIPVRGEFIAGQSRRLHPQRTRRVIMSIMNISLIAVVKAIDLITTCTVILNKELDNFVDLQDKTEVYSMYCHVVNNVTLIMLIDNE